MSEFTPRFRVSAFVFRLLLRVYPRRFRARFGTQMEEDFRELLLANASRGVVSGRLTSWKRATADLIASAPRERFRVLSHAYARRSSQERNGGNRWWSSVAQDTRFALRSLTKAPGFSAVAIVTLALGIGANTAIFTLVNGILLRSPPFSDPENIVAVWQHDIGSDNSKNSISPATFRDFEQQNTVFERLAAFYDAATTVTGDDQIPERIGIGRVLPGFFAVLGTEARLGRTFRQEEREPGNDHVAILSSEYWGRRYGSDSSVVGTTVALNRVDYEIIGVMPPGIDLSFAAKLWIPIAFNEARWNNRGSHYLGAIGRMAQGVTIDEARSELETIAARLGVEYPEENEGWGVTVLSLQDDLVGHLRPALLLLQAAVLLVLAIACVNVANLQLARGSKRHTELAIRTALGAHRGRLIRFLLTESLALAAIGAAAGLAFAWGISTVVMAFAPATLANIQTVTLDHNVLLFTGLVASLTGFLFGITPALRSSKIDLGAALKEGSRSTTRTGQRLHETLVIVEVALSLVLLVGAGLLINSFVHLMEVDSGIDTENALTVRVSIPAAVYPEATQRVTFFRQLHQAVEEIPGVESSGLASVLPVTGIQGWWRNGFYRPEFPPQTPADQVSAYLRWISPGYLETLGIPLLQGRAFQDTDTAEQPNVILIDETMARQFFPNEDAIGKRILVRYNDWEAEIVGIVGSTQQTSLSEPLEPHMYVSYLQTYEEMFVASMVVVVRTRANPLDLVGPVRNAILTLDKQLAPSQIETLEQRLSDSVASERFNLLLVSAFAAVALLLSSVGLYGVIAYLVGQRTRELGVRMALGARGKDVLALVLRHGVTLTAIGIGVGVAGIFALNRLLSQFLFGVSATDLTTIATVSVLLGGIAVLAVTIPARRAARIDPISALRHE